MIKSVRKILNIILRLQEHDEESMYTPLCEAEAIINIRPITKAFSDPNDLKALTPNHLFLLKSKPSLPPGLFDNQDLYSSRRWKQIRYIADIFWKWLHPSCNFAIGDIVLIVDDCTMQLLGNGKGHPDNPGSLD